MTTCPIEFRLESSNQPAQPYFWRCCTAGATRKLAYSENYTTKQAAKGTVSTIQAGNASYPPPSQGTNKLWYFHIKGKNGEILARSSSAYASSAAAQADSYLISGNAPEAPLYE
jgi:uncharacterized protein YegP (UPF0339 family)